MLDTSTLSGLKQNDPKKYKATLEFGNRYTRFWDDPNRSAKPLLQSLCDCGHHLRRHEFNSIFASWKEFYSDPAQPYQPRFTGWQSPAAAEPFSKQLMRPATPAGVEYVGPSLPAPDGTACAYGYRLLLSDLYLVGSLK